MTHTGFVLSPENAFSGLFHSVLPSVPDVRYYNIVSASHVAGTQPRLHFSDEVKKVDRSSLE
jgi:hypothetical protein